MLWYILWIVGLIASHCETFIVIFKAHFDAWFGQYNIPPLGYYLTLVLNKRGIQYLIQQQIKSLMHQFPLSVMNIYIYMYIYFSSCNMIDGWSSVASFTKEVNLQLAKRPLKINGRLANRRLTSLVKEATDVFFHFIFWHQEHELTCQWYITFPFRKWSL